MRTEEEQMIAKAIDHLKLARTLLTSARAPRAVIKVRLALKSAEGAARNASNKAMR